MKIADISVRDVSGELEDPVGNPRRRELRRAGLVLRLSDVDGNVGFGEASPLPGFSSDSLEACRAALAALSPGALEACLSRPESWLARLGQAGALVPAGLPAARFAVETALLDLSCAREQRSPFDLLEHPALPRLELNAVLDGTRPDAFDHACALAQRGYTTLKVKIGAHWEPALDTLTELAEHGGWRLRADANRGLSARDLERALPRFAPLGLEFLEEPCVPELWPALPTERPPLALDETLGEAAPDVLPALLRASRASVVVLKPMALGGFSACFQLAETARALGCGVVVTHLFDGPIALRSASVLALLVQSPWLAAGLAAHAGLAAWPADPRLSELGSSLTPELFQARISPAHYAEALGG